MTTLWRTQRPRFPLYISDGCGRDYYIKFDNGGYWSTQFSLKKKPDYERPLYKNFHTLYHQAAPFKYWGNGHGRETYILKTNGLFHDQKPLCSYSLSDFLRGGVFSNKNNFRRKLFLSVSEKKYNNELRKFEKKLTKRLYTEPINLKKMLKKKYEISSNNDSGNNSGKCNNEESKNNINNTTEGNKSRNVHKNDKSFTKGFNTICNFYNNKGKKTKINELTAKLSKKDKEIILLITNNNKDKKTINEQNKNQIESLKKELEERKKMNDQFKEQIANLQKKIFQMQNTENEYDKD